MQPRPRLPFLAGFLPGLRELTLIAALCGAVAADAATLRGRVTAAESRLPLEGVQIIVQGADGATYTDRDGSYELSNLRPGPQTITAIYVGLPEVQRTVTVAGDAPNVLDLSMGTEMSVKLEKFVVEGLRAGQARAQNLRRSSSEILDVVASDTIGQFPDANAAEAVNRLPGVSLETNRGEGRFITIRGADKNFNNVTINGVNLPSQESDRSVALDNFPAGQLEVVAIAKTVTADNDGDAIGGAVRLQTKSPFDREGRFASAEAAGGWNEQNDDRPYRVSLVFSDRFGAAHDFGLLGSASYQRTPRGFEGLNLGYARVTLAGQPGLVPDNPQFEQRRFIRERTALSVRAEVRPTKTLRLYVDAVYNTFDLSEIRQRTTFRRSNAGSAVLDGDTFSAVTFTLRAAWWNGIARPAFSDLSGARSVDFTDSPVSVDEGNPDLKAAKAMNFDLMLDYALPRQGLITAGLFHKRIKDAIYSNRTIGTFEGQPAEFSRPENAGDGRITGLEVSYQQQFTFLPGILGGLGLSANGAVVDSRVEVPTRPGETFSFFKQSDTVGNLALTYQAHGFQVRAAWNWRSGALADLSEPGLDGYVDDRLTFDVTASYAITPRIRLFFEGANLTDAPERTYLGTRQRFVDNEYYGRNVLVGLSAQF